MSTITTYNVEGFDVELSDIRQGSENVILFIIQKESFTHIPNTLVGCMEMFRGLGFEDISVVGATSNGALLHMRLNGELFEFDYDY